MHAVVQPIKVAVLLATHNSGRLIEPQLLSLRENATRFTVHWLDDHSADDTRESVRALAAQLGIELKEWQQADRQGVPGAFLRLLEIAEADVYLFCDQDDIWEPGKIDATLTDLAPDLTAPTLCFSEPWVFRENEPANRRRYFEVMGIKPADAQRLSTAFIFNPAVGNTVGFTRPLRELFLAHRDIAKGHAVMHDWWMYLTALAWGKARMICDVPTTLYRQHPSNVFGTGLRGKKVTPSLVWQRQKMTRRLVARQAIGFALAAARTDHGSAPTELLAIADLTATLARRQSLPEVIHLLRRGAMPMPYRRAAWYAAACLLSDATT